MLNIAYFSNQIADLAGHGLARYSRELFAGLSALPKDLNVTPVAAWSSMEGASLARLKQESGLKLIPFGRRFTPLAWTFLNSPPIEHWLPETDVVHAVALGYPVATRKPLVVTVHDLGPLTHPEFFGNTSPWIMTRSLKQAVAQADAIICVSQSTADELISYAGSGVADRIHVIHEGVSPEFFQPVNTACLQGLDGLPPLGTPFIMATGKISPRKNIQGLIHAMSNLLDVIPHHLVLVGGDGWEMDEVYKQLGSPGVKERVHFPGYVTDELIEEMATNDQVVPYLDMPLQHAHPMTLRRMKRPANMDWVYKTLEKMKSNIPALALRTTFIVGYPGETDEEFQTLVNFIKEIRFVFFSY